jgi:hypothetical protein
MAAVTNVAESRAGGRAGGAAEPVLEADTRTRLERSLGAFGLLGALVAVRRRRGRACRLWLARTGGGLG